MTTAPPPQWATAYRYLHDSFAPPPSAGPAARVMPGVKVYDEAPDGCFWASGTLWWKVVQGNALLRFDRFERGHNGSRWLRAAVVDLYLPSGRELNEVALPSSSLSRDVEHCTAWTPLRILRDGRNRPWRAILIPAGAWHDVAAELNTRDA
ncbi:hypothetical protein [Streptomyces sp. NPDC094032]|uniref:hypothetical protein n=1 Tax=Streptomyces sp. NPDC094032 TaxID=3155308 RepID=UPI00331E53B6